ncbi:MAG: hypothetical protein JRJ84_18620, partial [Deltaproteobacteria bacterium]|nr:hypothetical protein [Deltaproteobacteria bacterium]
MYARFLPVIVLAASFPGMAAEPGETYDYTNDFEYDYVLGIGDAGETITGGAHYVVRYDNRREPIDYQNTASKLHPTLTGTYLKYDASRTSGSSDWDVFASNWWPQSKNGVGWRWTGGSQDYSDHSDTDKLSPIEKYDLLFHPGQTQTVAAVEHWNYTELDTPEAERGPKHSHPQFQALGPATAWELKEHGIYQSYHPDSWWGHCNGWASYVTADDGGAPERDIEVKVVNGQIRECAASESGCVLFRMGDIEALMGELYFNDTATFDGRRCNTSSDDMVFDEHGRPTDVACRDINAGTFHIAVVGLLNRGADHLATGAPGYPPFVIDYSYDHQVWNYPLTKYLINHTEEVTEAQAAALVGADSDYLWNASATKFVRVDMTYYMVSDSVGVSAMLLQADQRNVSLDPNE